MIYSVRRFTMISDVPVQEDQITSRELQIENMKMQRALMQNFRTQQKLQVEEKNAKMRQQLQNQRMLQKENEIDTKQAQQGTKATMNSTPEPNTGVYKRATVAKDPIGMKN